MAVFTRSKHITSPLDERVRDRLRGEFTPSASSGSDHDDPSSFSALLLADFLDSTADSDITNDSDTDADSPTPIPTNSPLAASSGALRALLSPPPSADPLRSRLLSDVESSAAASTDQSGGDFRRAVMNGLRERGYNAGICEARWEGDGARGLTAGSYEYIDVVCLGRRYIVDLGFRGEFEVARATEEYRRVAAELPVVVVAEAEEVRAAVRMMAEAARRSLKSSGMSVPPWRKRKYMMAKWFGFYRRTVNGGAAAAAAAAASVARAGDGEVRAWRAVGFGCGGGAW